jgi:hypothetical protein
MVNKLTHAVTLIPVLGRSKVRIYAEALTILRYFVVLRCLWKLRYSAVVSHYRLLQYHFRNHRYRYMYICM